MKIVVGVGAACLLLIVAVAFASGTLKLGGTELSPAEQESLTFIQEHTPEVENIFAEMTEAVRLMGDGDYEAAAPIMEAYIDEWSTIRLEWEAFPAAAGKVSRLEILFEDTMNDIFKVTMGVGDLLNGEGGDAALAATRAYRGDMSALQDELNDF